MPIELYTGKPGNGKTAFMMERLLKEAEKGERPIFAAGIDGLKPGLATVLEDPKKWNEFDANGDRIVPDGSLVFVDEAWKWFGHLHDASRQATPPHVLALAEHRHRGIDFVWTTQGPNQLYPFVRPLCADHFHCVRRFGTQVVDVYHWEELQEDVKSSTKREAARRSTRNLPEKAFGSYKSAEVHTIKKRIPKRLYVALALPVFLAVAVFVAYSTLSPSARAERIAEGTGSALAEPAPDEAQGTRARREPFTVETWAQRFVPRIAAHPMSAPAYDDRPVLAQPRIACMIGERVGCLCKTEQGTDYHVPANQCRLIVKAGGLYDPFRAPIEETRGGGEDSPPAMDANASASAPAASVVQGAQVNGYGDLGITNNPQAAP